MQVQRGSRINHQSEKHVNDGEGLAGVLVHVGVLVLDFHQRMAQNPDSFTFDEEHLSLGRILRVNLAVHANACNTSIVVDAFEEEDGDVVGLDVVEGELEGHRGAPGAGCVSLQSDLPADLLEEGVEPLLLHLGASPQQETT